MAGHPYALVRKSMHDLMDATIADEAADHDWTYEAVRPMPVPVSWRRGQRVRGDCSKGYQYLCRWAHGPDPMGRKFDPFGNSTTICMHLPHRHSLDDMEIGDAVTFGPDGDEHAAGVKELIKGANGKVTDLRLWSFGHEGAPGAYLLSEDHREYQLLKLPVPGYSKLPAEQLVLETGYFAWMQWTLGKGDWRHYGKRNRKVRPNVPRRIPLAWWKRRAKYVLKHKRKGNPAMGGPVTA